MTTSNIDQDELTVTEQDAFGLSRAAVMLDQARIKRDQDLTGLVAALNHNLELWIAIRTLVMRPENSLDQDIKGKLLKLSQYVAHKTLEHGEAISDEVVDSFININLQICEGLLDGRAN